MTELLHDTILKAEELHQRIVDQLKLTLDHVVELANYANASEEEKALIASMRASVPSAKQLRQLSFVKDAITLQVMKASRQIGKTNEQTQRT